MMMQGSSGALFGLSLILLLIGSQCLPVQRRQALQQPEWCRQSRPSSSKDSPCTEDDTVRRYFFHESKLRGCKKFGICFNDSIIYDDEMEEINYFQTYEECQQQCMQHVVCPNLTVGENMNKPSDNGLEGWGRAMVFTCANGYSLSDNAVKNSRTCQKNGTWSGTPPVCLKQCVAPPTVQHGSVAPAAGRYNQGSSVHYTCNVGYSLSGSATRTCGSNGEWSDKEPSCTCQGQVLPTGECMSCPEPPLIEHGMILAPNRSLFSEIKYVCNPTYSMIGNSTRVCGVDGMWSGEEPVCWKLMIVNITRGAHVDVTNQVHVHTITADSLNMDIKFEAVPSTPNPFEGMTPVWSHGVVNGDLPYGVKQEGSSITFDTIYESKEQSGTYYASFGNYTESFRLDVQVLAVPDKPDVVFLSITILPEKIDLSCVIVDSPDLEVTWYHDDVVLVDDERTDISIREDGGVLLASLVITDLTADDNGIYSCEANNSAGVDRMDKTLLPVLSDRVHPEKRSAEEEEEENSRKSPLCASDSLNTVTLLGQVKRQRRHTRSSSLTTYKVQVKRILHGSDKHEMGKDTAHRHLRTVVFTSNQPLAIEGGRRKLHTGTDYIFQGRLIDDTLFVSRKNVRRHSTQLENQVTSC